MSAVIPIRIGAASGLAALLVGGAGGALERGWPSANTPVSVADFVSGHRVAIVAQSMAFTLSAGLTLFFFSSLRSFLAGSKGEAEPAATAMFGASLVWASLQIVAQSFQVGVAMAHGHADPGLLWTMSAAFSMSNLPLGIALVAFVVAARQSSFPIWLSWTAVAAAAAELVLWCGTAVESGALSPNGWAGFVLYPFFAVWLAPTAIVMLKRTADHAAPDDHAAIRRGAARA